MILKITPATAVISPQLFPMTHPSRAPPDVVADPSRSRAETPLSLSPQRYSASLHLITRCRRMALSSSYKENQALAIDALRCHCYCKPAWESATAEEFHGIASEELGRPSSLLRFLLAPDRTTDTFPTMGHFRFWSANYSFPLYCVQLRPLIISSLRPQVVVPMELAVHQSATAVFGPLHHRLSVIASQLLDQLFFFLMCCNALPIAAHRLRSRLSVMTLHTNLAQGSRRTLRRLQQHEVIERAMAASATAVNQA